MCLCAHKRRSRRRGRESHHAAEAWLGGPLRYSASCWLGPGWPWGWLSMVVDREVGWCWFGVIIPALIGHRSSLFHAPVPLSSFAFPGERKDVTLCEPFTLHPSPKPAPEVLPPVWSYSSTAQLFLSSWLITQLHTRSGDMCVGKCQSKTKTSWWKTVWDTMLLVTYCCPWRESGSQNKLLVSYYPKVSGKV